MFVKQQTNINRFVLQECGEDCGDFLTGGAA